MVFAFNKAKTGRFNSNRHAPKKRYNLDVFKISKNDIYFLVDTNEEKV